MLPLWLSPDGYTLIHSTNKYWGSRVDAMNNGVILDQNPFTSPCLDIFTSQVGRPAFSLTSFFCFLGLHPQHMEVPRLGVQSELQLLACITATTTRDLSHVFELHHSSGQCWIPDPLSEARDRTHVLMDTIWIRFCCTTKGTPPTYFSYKYSESKQQVKDIWKISNSKKIRKAKPPNQFRTLSSSFIMYQIVFNISYNLIKFDRHFFIYLRKKNSLYTISFV